MTTTTASDLSPTTTVVPAASLWRGPLRPTTIGAVALVSVFAFEAMAITTAMPVIVAALDGLALYGIAFGATVVASIVGMVAAGIACDRAGPARPFALGAGLFAAGLAIAGLAPSMAVVVLGRGVQGLGSGMAIVTLYVLVDTYPERLQARVFAAFAAAWVVPALVGPAIAGLLAEHVHWRAVFLVVLVITLPGATLVGRRMRALPARPATPWRPADRRRLVAAVVAAGGAGALHLAGQSRTGWTIAMLLAAAIVAIGRSTRRLLPDGTLRLGRGLPTVIALRGVAATAFVVAEVLIPLLLTTHRGLTPTRAGVVLTGGAIGWSFGSWLQGRVERAPHRWLRDGFLTLVAGLALVTTTITPAVPVAMAQIGWVVAGAGMGAAIPTLSVLVLRLSSDGDQGGNVSSLQVADALASGAGLAAVGTLLAVGGTRPAIFLVASMVALALAATGAAAAHRAVPAHRES